MSKIVGIDLGTTNSLVATVDSGIPLVIADAQGRRLTPSVVHFPAGNAAVLVGQEANRVRALQPATTIYSVKRFMGRRGGEITQEEKGVSYPLHCGAGGVSIPVRDRNYSPEEISAEVLKKVKADAELYFGEPVTRAVITVPAYFNDAQRQATKRAGELAGFTVERIVNEPTAAALAYGLDKLKEKSKIAVYDLGGGTFDLSILELNEGVFQVLATNGNTRLGGDDLDRRIVEFLAGKIAAAGGPRLAALGKFHCPPNLPMAHEPSDRSAGHRPGQLADSRSHRAEAVLGAPVHGQRPEMAADRTELGLQPGSSAPSREEKQSWCEKSSPSPRPSPPEEGERVAASGQNQDGGLALVPGDNSLGLLARIREAAEQAKIKLSTETEVEVVLPFLTPDFSFSCQLTRGELESLTGDLIARTRPHCLRALADAKLEPKDLDQVILVGGQTRMPLVRKFVADLFGCAEFEETRGGLRLGVEYHQASGPQLNTSQNPDEAVALGAAIQAEILSGGFRSVLLLDVTPLSLGLETFGGLMNVIIPRNSTIPVKAGEMFTTAVDHQRSMLIHVLQGERERAKDNWSLGKFTLEFEPAPRGVPRVGVQFEIDANGILHVLARDTRTGREKTVEMQSAVDVDDTAVQQMVEESVEHAFDDLAVRRWVEARLKADETLAATRKALAEMGGELEGEYRAKIEAAAREVAAALATEQAGGGDLRRLQAGVAALDETTKPLAELLMDKAMEAMLRRRGLIQ